MAMEKIGDGLKKFLLVGIGAAATTVEKSQQIVEDLIKKGEITVEQGKELNKELQHNVKKTLDARKADAESFEEKISKMSADELEALKKAIRDAEGAATKLKDAAAEKIVEACRTIGETGVIEEDRYMIASQEGLPS